MGKRQGCSAGRRSGALELCQRDVRPAERSAELPREPLAHWHERLGHALLVARNARRIDVEFARQDSHATPTDQPVYRGRPEGRAERPGAHEVVRMLEEVKVQRPPKRLAHFAIEVLRPLERLGSP